MRTVYGTAAAAVPKLENRAIDLTLRAAQPQRYAAHLAEREKDTPQLC
jgi:hypothetical protein